MESKEKLLNSPSSRQNHLLVVPADHKETRMGRSALSENEVIVHQDERQQQGDDGSSSEPDSQNEADKQREKAIQKFLHQEELKKANDKKMVVGTGFSMDVTEFFQFKKKELVGDDVSLFQEISGSRVAWLILLYSVSTGAMIPGWIMNIPASKLARICWRFVMQAIMMIPFAMYEYRHGNAQIKQKYRLSYILRKENIIKPIVSSLATTMWFTIILSSFEWTSVSHGLVLGALSNFFLSLGRSWKKSSHDLESGGQILILGGLILMVYDSITFNQKDHSSHDFTALNTFFFYRTWWERVAFDLLAFTVSFLMSQFSKFTSDISSYYPPFLSMLIVNTFVFINVAMSSYFINGCQWTFDTFYGLWSLFSDQHFAGFMYMAIILSLGQIISLVMITRMFPDPIIPALAMTLEPFIATLICDFSGIQRLPGSFTIIGYVFCVPGACLILVGQCIYQRMSAKSKDTDDKFASLMAELRQLKQRSKTREQKKKERQTKYKAKLMDKRISRKISGMGT